MEQYLQVDSSISSNLFSSMEQYLWVDSVLLAEYIFGNKTKILLPEDEYFVWMMISKYIQHDFDTSTSDANDYKMKRNNISFIKLFKMNKIQSDSQRSGQCIDSQHVLDTSPAHQMLMITKWRGIVFCLYVGIYRSHQFIDLLQ